MIASELEEESSPSMVCQDFSSVEYYSMCFVCAVVNFMQFDTTPTSSESGKTRPLAMCENTSTPVAKRTPLKEQAL